MASFRDPYHLRKHKFNFYCPLCQHYQTTNTIKAFDWKHQAQILLATAAIVIAGWPFFGLKSLSFYFVVWTVFEIFYRVRKRQALVCQSCGFDPFLYAQDKERARKQLRDHWQKRIETENLFSGKKLKNYRTNGLNKDSGDIASASKATNAESLTSSQASP